jgi:hypothetical protein
MDSRRLAARSIRCAMRFATVWSYAQLCAWPPDSDNVCIYLHGTQTRLFAIRPSTAAQKPVRWTRSR